MTIKRNNWTNQEIVKFLSGYIRSEQFVREHWAGSSEERVLKMLSKASTHNGLLYELITEFEDMDRPEDDHAAKGMDTETGRIFMVGPRLPQ